MFGLITLDGEGFFQRYDSFTGKEFVEFLKAACERFGKILMITDGAPQHRPKFVREEIGRLDGVELQFLPPGCPDLNAIEEVCSRETREMCRAVQLHVQRHHAEVVPAKTDIEVPLQKSIGRGEVLETPRSTAELNRRLNARANGIERLPPARRKSIRKKRQAPRGWGQVNPQFDQSADADVEYAISKFLGLRHFSHIASFKVCPKP